jgi:methionine-rich copper-binding protein CopC
VRRLPLLAFVLLAALLALPGLALAHAELTASEPAAGSTVPTGLSRLILAFSEPPGPGSAIQLTTGTFEGVSGVNSYVANGQLWADVDPPLQPGTYTVQWSVVSVDGHTVTGSYQFAVADAPVAFPWTALLCLLILLAVVGSLPFLFARLQRRAAV